MAIKTYFRLAKNSAEYRTRLSESIEEAVFDNPLMVIASYNHRELVYHPAKMKETEMYEAM